MLLSLLHLLICILFIFLNRKNIKGMLILLAITLIWVSSTSFDNTLDQTYSMFIKPRAVTESAVGFGILVAFYRLRESLAIEYK